MKKIAITGALLLGILGAASVAAAEEGKGKGRWKKAQRFLKKIGVSDETLGKAKELRAEWRKARKPLREEIRAKRKELREVFKAGTIDTAKVDALAGEIADKRSALIKARISHRAKFLALLTPEQRAKVIKRMENRRKKWRAMRKKMRRRMMMH